MYTIIIKSLQKSLIVNKIMLYIFISLVFFNCESEKEKKQRELQENVAEIFTNISEALQNYDFDKAHENFGRYPIHEKSYKIEIYWDILKVEIPYYLRNDVPDKALASLIEQSTEEDYSGYEHGTMLDGYPDWDYIEEAGIYNGYLQKIANKYTEMGKKEKAIKIIEVYTKPILVDKEIISKGPNATYINHEHLVDYEGPKRKMKEEIMLFVNE